MRARSAFLTLGAALLSLCALAAQPAAPSRVMVFPRVSPDEIPAVARASDRLVWDRLSGAVVAQISEDELPAVRSLKGETLCAADDPAAFQNSLKAVFPDFAAESAKPGENSHYAVMEPAHLVKPAGAPGDRSKARAGVVPENSCISEGFEYTPIWTEDGGSWWHYQGGMQPNQGDYFWIDWNCDAHYGSWCADSVLGGDIGSTLPCGSNYDYNTDSWMEYAPEITCLVGVPVASVGFWGKVSCTLSSTDYGFYYTFSKDGQDYYGFRLSGNWADKWYPFNKDVRKWPSLGDLTTYPWVALAFAFESGAATPSGFGARVDDIALSFTPVSITQVQAGYSPFRLFVTGLGFAPGAQVYVDGLPAPTSVYKDTTYVVAKGGAGLKAMVPAGQTVCVTVANPNGAVTPCYNFVR